MKSEVNSHLMPLPTLNVGSYNYHFFYFHQHYRRKKWEPGVRMQIYRHETIIPRSLNPPTTYSLHAREPFHFTYPPLYTGQRVCFKIHNNLIGDAVQVDETKN